MQEPITEQQTYRLITRGLEIRRGPGQPERHVKRPRNDKSDEFLDSDDAPTLVTFEPGDLIDIPFLLQVGAIIPYEAPKAEMKKGGAKSGETP